MTPQKLSSDFRIAGSVRRGKPFKLKVDGREVSAYPGETVAAALAWVLSLPWSSLVSGLSGGRRRLLSWYQERRENRTHNRQTHEIDRLTDQLEAAKAVHRQLVARRDRHAAFI